MRNGGICSMNEKGGAGVKIPRFMLAAPNSGSGKTLITCGLLQALKNRGRAAGFIQVRTRITSIRCFIPKFWVCHPGIWTHILPGVIRPVHCLVRMHRMQIWQ